MDEYTRERLSDFKNQIDRIVSHIESERDRIVEVSKRLDQLAIKVEDLKILVNKLDDIIRNGGNGLIGRTRSLEDNEKRNEKAWHKWAAILGGLSGIAALVIEIIRK